MSTNLMVVGLGYDIIGVLVLALALVTPRIHLVRAQAGTFYGGNKALFRTLLIQRFDARFGLPFILFGFVLQLVAALGRDVDRESILLVLIPLVVGLIVYVVGRVSVSRRSDAVYDELEIAESE